MVPQPLNYLDPSLSVGQCVVSLRQALQGIASKVEQVRVRVRDVNGF